MTAAKFRGLRREIAAAARGQNAPDDRKRTLYQLSKFLGRRPGDIQKTVRQMHRDGLLEANDQEPGRGTFFWLNPAYGNELDEALEDDQPNGQLAPEQRVLEINVPQGADPYAVFARRDLSGSISWMAEWGGDGERLIGMTKGTSLRATEQLIAALAEIGVKCVHRRVGEVMSADELRRTANAMDEVSV